MKAHIVFEKELNRITDPCIREFTRVIFDDLCPDYFWEIPASVRGHHVPEARTQGGLVYHTKLAVRFAHSFIDMWHQFDNKEHDLTIAATLLHDMMKRGRVEDDLETFQSHHLAVANHGRYCATVIDRHLASDVPLRDLLNGTDRRRILNGVKLHMGRWTHGLAPHEIDLLHDDRVVRTTHLADYAASRPLHKWLYQSGE